jgi:hypothetical protein
VEKGRMSKARIKGLDTDGDRNERRERGKGKVCERKERKMHIFKTE